MDTMAPTRPTALHKPTRPIPLQKPLRQAMLQKRCVSLPAGPMAPGKARGQVRATLQAWEVPVDTSVAALLTSELVTNAMRHETGDTITLVITCGYGQLHVDVHDTSGELPVPLDGPPDAETGRGLMLVAGLSSSWGYYRTPTARPCTSRSPSRTASTAASPADSTGTAPADSTGTGPAASTGTGPAKGDRQACVWLDQPSRSRATSASACSTVTVVRFGSGSARLPPVRKTT